jgi:hypothetical protein
MGGVFVNYRSDDTLVVAAAIHHALAQRFGADQVFRDQVSMLAGERYPDELRAALERVDVLVAVLGPQWLTLREGGVRRIDRPADWVRLELRRAFERGIPVIPVLLRDLPENTVQPRREDLPDDIAELALTQSTDVSLLRLGADLDRLTERLVALVPTLAIPELFAPPPPPRGPGNAPSTLLRAEYRVVPFIGRDRELADLRDWTAGPAACSARLLAGPAGVGKTRLALALTDALVEDGWLAGVVDSEAPAVQIARTAAIRKPLLAVVDDAELRAGQLLALAGALTERSARLDSPSRLLLLGRASGAWIDELRQGSALFRDLTTTILSAAQADQQFRTAQAAFGALADVPIPSFPAVTSVLEIHAAALVGSPDLAAVLAHDAEHLRGQAPVDPDLAATVHAVATLCRPASDAQARALLSRLPNLLGEDDPAIERCRTWLATTYPGRHPLDAARPEPLGEQLVADQLTARPAIAKAIAAACTDDQIETALTVLGRAQSRHHMLAEAVVALVGVDPERLLSPGITAAQRLAEPEPFVRALARALADATLSPQSAAALMDRLSTAGPELGPLKAVAQRLFTGAMSAPIDQYAKTLDIPESMAPLQQLTAKVTDLLQDFTTALIDPGSGRMPKNPDGTDMVPEPLWNLFSGIVNRNIFPPNKDDEKDKDR